MMVVVVIVVVMANSGGEEVVGVLSLFGILMFTPIVMEEEEQYILKPMNCPHHIMIYKSKPRSYRELPIRLADPMKHRVGQQRYLILAAAFPGSGHFGRR